MGRKPAPAESSENNESVGNAGMVMLSFITVSIILMIIAFYFLYVIG